MPGNHLTDVLFRMKLESLFCFAFPVMSEYCTNIIIQISLGLPHTVHLPVLLLLYMYDANSSPFTFKAALQAVVYWSAVLPTAT